MQTRREEAEESARILGISARENLGMKDGFLVNSEEYQLEIVKMIRRIPSGNRFGKCKLMIDIPIMRKQRN